MYSVHIKAYDIIKIQKNSSSNSLCIIFMLKISLADLAVCRVLTLNVQCLYIRSKDRLLKEYVVLPSMYSVYTVSKKQGSTTPLFVLNSHVQYLYYIQKRKIRYARGFLRRYARRASAKKIPCVVFHVRPNHKRASQRLALTFHILYSNPP